MITIEQWQNDEGKRSRLSELLSDEVMQEALYLVQLRGIPVAREVSDAAHIAELYALDHAKAIGWGEAIRMLHQLSRSPARRANSLDRGWVRREVSAEEQPAN